MGHNRPDLNNLLTGKVDLLLPDLAKLVLSSCGDRRVPYSDAGQFGLF